MAPLVKDGVYKIRNGQYPLYVADLINGDPTGPICAYRDRPSNRHDKWRLRNVGHGGNQVTLENISTPGSYANAEQFDGASLVGSGSHTIWTIVNVGGGKYYLQSEDANYVWEMPHGADYVNIVLVRHTAKDNTKWTFDRVGA